MENEEIKVWNEGKPHLIGSSGIFGVFGGVLGRGVKLFSNTVKQYLKENCTPVEGFTPPWKEKEYKCPKSTLITNDSTN